MILYNCPKRGCVRNETPYAVIVIIHLILI